MYTDINPITNEYGNNKGGIRYFHFVPKEWLSNDVELSMASGTVTTPLTLIAGKAWLRGDCIEQSMLYEEKDDTIDGNPIVKATLTGVVLKQDINRHINLSYLRYHQLVVLYYDQNDKIKVVGTRKSGMSLLVDTTSGQEYKDATQYLITLVHSMPDPAPFYVIP